MAHPPSLYWESALTRGLYRRAEPGALEGATTEIWDSITPLYFPIGHFHTTHEQIDSEGGKSDITVLSYSVPAGDNGQFPDIQFKPLLIVECKKPGEASQPRKWEDATVQLREYCKRRAIENTTEKVYACVAIGKKCRFYLYNGKAAPGVNPMEPALPNFIPNYHGYWDLFSEADARLVDMALSTTVQAEPGL